MGTNIETIFDVLNTLHNIDELTHFAYSTLYDEIALFVTPQKMWLCNGELCCPQCGAICKSYYHYCNECGQAVKWDKLED